MPKQRKAPSKLNTLLQLLAVFATSYLLITTLIWGAQRVHYYHGVFEGLASFAEKEQDSLVKNVFETGITKAKICTSLAEAEKVQCQDEVRIFIATKLREEILFSSNMSDSLHFIKREGDTLYMLNWEGKLMTTQVGDRYSHLIQNSFMDTSTEEEYKEYEVKLPPSNTSLMRYFNLFAGRCKYFDVYDYNSCQVVVTIPLDEHSDGYLVSMMVLTEESMWWLYSLIIPLIFLQLFLSSPTSLFTTDAGSFALLSFSILAIPALITYIYWRRYLKK